METEHALTGVNDSRRGLEKSACQQAGAQTTRARKHTFLCRRCLKKNRGKCVGAWCLCRAMPPGTTLPVGTAKGVAGHCSPARMSWPLSPSALKRKGGRRFVPHCPGKRKSRNRVRWRDRISAKGTFICYFTPLPCLSLRSKGFVVQGNGDGAVVSISNNPRGVKWKT